MTAPGICLYILMRTDLASLSGGKAIAQGAHAANQCQFDAYSRLDIPSTDPAVVLRNNALSEALEDWQGQTPGGFGTTIVLGASGAQMLDAVAIARQLGLHAGIVHDPSYPLRDGEVTHRIPLDTGAYVFGQPAEAKLALDGLLLLP
jgi:peptidyl-tRNA hydrolase